VFPHEEPWRERCGEAAVFAPRSRWWGHASCWPPSRSFTPAPRSRLRAAAPRRPVLSLSCLHPLRSSPTPPLGLGGRAAMGAAALQPQQQQRQQPPLLAF
jgi:hypothetical protein